MIGHILDQIKVWYYSKNPYLLRNHTTPNEATIGDPEPCGHRPRGSWSLMVAKLGIKPLVNEYGLLVLSHDPWKWGSLGVGKWCNSHHPLSTLGQYIWPSFIHMVKIYTKHACAMIFYPLLWSLQRLTLYTHVCIQLAWKSCDKYRTWLVVGLTGGHTTFVHTHRWNNLTALRLGWHGNFTSP